MRRATICNDVMNEFSDPLIVYCLINAKVVDNRVEEEKGKGKVVMLDVLSYFWHEVYNSYTTDKVATIRHDMQKDQWQPFA